MKSRLILVVLVLCLSTPPAFADVLVLVHGYLGSGTSWAESGVLDRLQRRGYQHAGEYSFSPQGILYRPTAAEHASKPVITLNLPSQAPVVVQADWLAAYLHRIHATYPDQGIQLAAHSAGGVVARMMLVRHGKMKVKRLITIASPHLGTGRAIQALDATDNSGMFGFVKSWLVRRKTGDALYATLHHSRGVLLDLAPPAPGNMLFWLNQQPHPDIGYTSIMRIGTVYMPGDQWVPPMSQDMNQVPALAGRSQTYSMAQGHLLGPTDGELIANLLTEQPPAKAKSGAPTKDNAGVD